MFFQIPSTGFALLLFPPLIEIFLEPTCHISLTYAILAICGMSPLLTQFITVRQAQSGSSEPWREYPHTSVFENQLIRRFMQGSRKSL
jgi:hypothetical protein